MGKTYDTLDAGLRDFIAAQKMFFVATAPLSGDGHVNVSPKGYDSFAVIDDHTVAYADLGGSGIETHAHVVENGRLTIMFCALDGPANILRLYGRGTAYDFTHPEFDHYAALFPNFDRLRGVIKLDITRIADSCGWGVPFYEFKGEREQLKRHVDNKQVEEWYQSRLVKNTASIDGLPGLVAPVEQK